jgi:argininosuccinate lyase
LRLMGAFMAAIRIDEDRVRRHIDESCATITELAESLVRREGITSRQAHEIASRLARQVIAERRTLATLPYESFAAAFREIVGRPPVVAADEIGRFATPEHFIAVRTMLGGPAPAALAASLARYRARLAEDAAALTTYRKRMEDGDRRLRDAVQRHRSPRPTT